MQIANNVLELDRLLGQKLELGDVSRLTGPRVVITQLG